MTTAYVEFEGAVYRGDREEGDTDLDVEVTEVAADGKWKPADPERAYNAEIFGVVITEAAAKDLLGKDWPGN